MVRVTRHETPTTRWELAVREPAPRVRPFVGSLCGYTEETGVRSRRTEFPSLGVAVIFDFGALRIVDDTQTTHHPGGFVAGVGDRFAITEHDGRSSGIQVNLSLLAARRIFGIPLEELTNRVVTFDDLVGAKERGLCARMQETAGWDARFDRIETFVAERIARAREIPPVVGWALDRIERSGGRLDIAALARDSGFSQKHLTARFREHVGMPPKRVARLVRFDRVIQYLRAGGRADWGEVAHRFGYFDQPHLNREIKAFTGGTPTEARAAVQEVGDLFG